MCFLGTDEDMTDIAAAILKVEAFYSPAGRSGSRKSKIACFNSE
jgi:hypothetical protein